MRRWAGAAVLVAVTAAPASAAHFAFAYTYPRQAAAIAPLRAWLEADKAKLRADTARDAAAAKREAAKSGFPYRAYDVAKTWKVVTATPRFLSLSVQSYAFTGGAHGNTGSAGLVWDKAAKRRLAPIAVFAGPQALWQAVRQPYCAGLRAEQHRRDAAALTGATFATCPDLSQLTLLLGSSGGGRIDRLGLVADQYVAGPYAEGVYEVTLPVTPAVLRAVKPAYRAAFASRR